MAYTKNTWQTGDVVTSAKLNNIENGVGVAYPLLVGTDGDTGNLTATWQTIFDKMHSGGLVFIQLVSTATHEYAIRVKDAQLDGDEYWIETEPDDSTPLLFKCDSADGYPEPYSDEELI